MTATVEQDRWYPSPPPSLDAEDDDAYTDRLTGADRTGRSPYDHYRNRQCSIGYHSECSDPAGGTCKCPCHRSGTMTEEQMAALSPATKAAAAKLAELYDLPDPDAHYVMAVAGPQFERPGIPPETPRGCIALALAAAYESRVGDGFLTDVVGIYGAALAGTLR